MRTINFDQIKIGMYLAGYGFITQKIPATEDDDRYLASYSISTPEYGEIISNAAQEHFTIIHEKGSDEYNKIIKKLIDYICKDIDIRLQDISKLNDFAK